MPLKIAVVGAGPAGFYTADALLKLDRDVQVDIVERLPTPFGLIRAGVAPDHQTTKKIAKKFEKTLAAEGAEYFGNVELGADVTLEEMHELYDAIVLTVGGGLDSPANIPGEDKAGVFGSAEFVSWYNGHPDYTDLNPDLKIENAAVIGNGNVAIDVARLLMRSPEELTKFDLPDYARDAINGSSLKNITMFGRRGPVDAKFTNVELRELGHLEECMPVVDPDQLPDDIGEIEDEREKRLKERNLTSLKEYAELDTSSADKVLGLRFFASPIEILGGDRVEGVRFEKTKVEDGRAVGTGETFDFPCELVVSAIGYRSAPVPGAPFRDDWCVIPNEDGRVSDGLYVAGWIKRGPSGVISTNRPDGVAAASHINEDIPNDGGKEGRDGLSKLLGKRDVRIVNYSDWQKIDAAEIANAVDPAPRKKFTRVVDMLAVLG
jgi:NADPH-dependent glutamate synthase beta subunit-like oxidoreductase